MHRITFIKPFAWVTFTIRGNARRCPEQLLLANNGEKRTRGGGGDNKRRWKTAATWAGKKGCPVQSKGAKVLKPPPSHVDIRACLHPVAWTTTITDAVGPLVLRHVGTPRLFSFGPRPRIPWKIISCVNGRLVLHGASLRIFPFLPSTFATLLPALHRAASHPRLRRATAFS